MKVGEQVSSHAVGMGRTQAFQIKSSSKAFEILSSGIYSDKILAPIRELSANAVDAHKVVGQTRQFQTTLPTQLSPIFRVRDFGPGLSEEDTMTLYTTYFESTKSDSNDYIGCLGLGSKSPFAYTDSFTVESYQGGTLKVYAAHLIEGLPSISKVSETPTTEDDGLAVSFGVQVADIQRFQEKAFNLYSWFSLKPQLNIAVPAQYKDNNVGLLEAQGMYLKEAGTYGSAPVHVLMGEIAYPVRAANLQQGYDWDRTYQGLVIRAEIGDVDIATSRESLGFTEKTKQWLRAKVAEAPKVFAEEVVNLDIDGSKDWWTAALKAETYRKFQILKHVKFSYKGTDIPASYLQISTTKAKTLYVSKRLKKVLGRDGKIYFNDFDVEKMVFYRNDVKNGFIKRLMVGEPGKDILLIEPLGDATIQEVCELLHISPNELKDLSTINYEREKRGKRAGTVNPDKFINISGVSPQTMDMTKPVYLIPVRRNYVVINNRKVLGVRWNNVAVSSAVKAAIDQGWIEADAQVTGIPANLMNRATSNGCKDFFALVWPKIVSYVAAHPKLASQANHTNVEVQVKYLFELLGDTPITPRSPLLWKMKARCEPEKDSTTIDPSVAEAYHGLQTYYGETVVPALDSQLESLWDEFISKDPLGKIWFQSYHQNVKKDIALAIKERALLWEHIHDLEDKKPVMVPQMTAVRLFPTEVENAK